MSTFAAQERDLEEHGSQVDIGTMEGELEAMQAAKLKAEEQLSRLQQEQHRVSLQAGARRLLEERRKEKRAKEEAFQNKWGSESVRV